MKINDTWCYGKSYSHHVGPFGYGGYIAIEFSNPSGKHEPVQIGSGYRGVTLCKHCGERISDNVNS